MKTLFSGLFVLFFVSNATLAQTEVSCLTAVDTSAYKDRLRSSRNSKSSLQSSRSRALDVIGLTQKLAITVHIVRNSNGTGGISESFIYNEIDKINGYYVESGLQFYIDAIKYINNTGLYNFQTSMESSLADSRDVTNTINMYFVKQIGFFGGSACGYAYLPEQELDRILISEECGLDGNTIAHEIGHYFDLLHTHGSVNSYTASEELVDGSNCSSTGDLLCDTPADPMLSNNVNSSCVYTGSFRDANGQIYQPDTHNMLSYSRGSCRDSFSSGQHSRMANAYVEFRNYLKTKPVLAAFEADKVQLCQGDQIAFTDNSQQASSWNWTFEGGTPQTSGLQNPVVTYNSPGSFAVTLEVSGEGLDDLVVIENYIKVMPAPVLAAVQVENFESYQNSGELETSESANFAFELNTSFSSQGHKSIWVNAFTNEFEPESKSRFYSNPITENLASQFLLQFDLAYKYRPGFSEGLEIFTEGYCDGTSTRIFEQSESDLSGHSESASEFFPESSEWRTEGLFFTVQDSDEPFNLIFEYSSQGGNNIFIDNIRIRPFKATDTDSLVLLSIYESFQGQLPWDISANLNSWDGVTISAEGRVVGIDFSDFGLDGALPTTFENLDHLISLVIDNNAFTSIDNITLLTSLESFSATGNKLAELPSNWTPLHSLSSVDLSNNDLTDIPPLLLNSSSLQYLNLRNNQLSIPDQAELSVSESIERLNLSANSLINSPSFVSTSDDVLFELSQNNLSFETIANSYTSLANYSPQLLIGEEEYRAVETTISLICPIPSNSSNTLINWYRNNELIQQNSANLSISDVAPAYYTCRATDNRVPEVILNSKPVLINTFKSICDQNLAGTYQAVTLYTDENNQEIEINESVELSAAGTRVYFLSDMSFGVENQIYNSNSVPATIDYDCGHLYAPISKNYPYIILSTNLSVNNGQLVINWINERGGKGTSILLLSEAGLSNETDILSFEFSSQSSPALINAFEKTVEISVGCRSFSNIPTFELSDGAQAYVADELQTSGSSAQDFTEPLNYMIVSEDGVSSAEWTISLIEDPSIITASYTVIDQSFCDPTNGRVSIDAILVDGLDMTTELENFEILWSDTPLFQNVIGNELSIENLEAGEYYLRIVEKSSGCGIEFADITIDDATPIPNLTIAQVEPDRSCGGENTGRIETNISGLSNDLGIKWRYKQNGSWTTLAQLDGLLIIDDVKSGSYRQVITDNLTGCTYRQEVEVESAPSVITATASVLPNSDCDIPNGNISITTIDINGVNLVFPAQGYSVAWYDNSSLQNAIATSFNLSGVSAGTYFLKIKDDALFCTSQIYSFFIPSEALSIPLDLTKSNNTTCSPGEANGVIGINLGEQGFGYTFEWFAGNQIGSYVLSRSPIISGITGGTYTVKVTSTEGDESGCFSTLTSTIFNDLEKLNISVSGNSVTRCDESNGMVEVSEFLVDGLSTNLTNPYEVEWSQSRNFNNVLSNKQEITELPVGTYYCRVTNASTGCNSNVATATIDLILPSISPKFDLSSNTNCVGPFNGQIDLSGLNSIEDYRISWYNQPPGEQAAQKVGGLNLTNLKAGKYYTTVEHIASGCINEYEHIISDNILFPEVNVEVSNNINCSQSNGRLTLTSVNEGGLSKPIDDYEILWSSSPSFEDVLGTGVTLSSLEEGLYYLKLKNAMTGCDSRSYSFEINDEFEYPTISLLAMEPESPALGESGNLTIDVEHEGAYEINWYASGDLGGLVLGTTHDINDLKAGAYVAMVITENACSVIEEFVVEVDNRQLQTIETTLPTEVFIDFGDIELIGESSSGLPVTFEVISGPGNISSNMLRLSDPGEIILRASVEGSIDYYYYEDEFIINVKPLITLAGTVDGALTGIVRLYDAQWQLIKQQPFNSSSYLLSGLQPGEYYLQLEQTGVFANTIATYYPSTYNWANAQLIDLTSDLNLDLTLISLPELEVGSIIEGLLTRKSGNSLLTFGELKIGGEPIDNGRLLLIELSSNEPFAKATSEFNGELSLGPVPSGNYFLYIDHIGNSIDLSSVVFSVDGMANEQLTLELGDNDEVELVVVSGINDWSSGEINLFPNPVTNELNVGLERGLSYPVDLRVFNLAGAMLVSEMIAPGSASFQLPLTSLPSGTYLVQLSDPKGSITKKIIKR